MGEKPRNGKVTKPGDGVTAPRNANAKQGRSPRKPRGSTPSGGGFRLTAAQEEALAAISLLAIAVLTAFGAFNLSRGNILDGWTDILGVLFGWGRMLAPLFFGGLGLWLLLDSLDLRPDIGGERPLGLLILFLILLTVLHITPEGGRGMAAASRGEGGGLIGHFISDALIGAIGVPGTFLLLIIAFCIGLVLLFQISVKGALAATADRVRGLRSGWKSPVPSLIKPVRAGLPPAEEKTPRRAAESKPARGQAQLAEPEEGKEATPLQSPTRPAIAARIVGAEEQAPVHAEWRLPKVEDLLIEATEHDISAEEIRKRVRQIEETLRHFAVPAKVTTVKQGPTITQYGVEPGFVEQKAPDGSIRKTKVKVSRISALQHDLELALAASPIRVEAPVPGESYVGIEVPNDMTSMVSLRGVMETEPFKKESAKSHLALAFGQDVSGQPIVDDLASMPHLLIAGATGSGKSVCINSIIACLLITNTPDDLKFVMVDPKRVELTTFNGIPHLLRDVVVEMDRAVEALHVAVQEMDNRFRMFSVLGARNIDGYNSQPPEKRREVGLPEAKLPYIVLIVDELADLMMIAPDQVEKSITRLAQMARATGIHLVLATQRPSVDVVTGLIKANFPSRISFAVTSQIDSRVVLDTPGAEKLLGRGDMLYMASDSSKLARLQGCYVSDEELDRLVSYWKGFVEEPGSYGGRPDNSFPGELSQSRGSPASVVISPVQKGPWVQSGLWSEAKAGEKARSEEDELLDQAVQVIRSMDRASVSLLQRKLRIGYARAAKIMDLLEQRGYVGPEEGSPAKGRKVLLGAEPGGRSIAGPQAAGVTGDENLDGFDDWTDEDWEDLDKA